jgi:hypothetical protein
MDMCTVICYWYVGSNQPLVPPLKYAKATDFPPHAVKRMRGTMSMMKKLILEIVERRLVLAVTMDV